MLAVLGCALPGTAGAADVDSAGDPLFASDTVLSIELEGPWRAIAYDRDPDPEPRPGVLRLTGAEGVETFEVMVSPRGKSRRDRDRCQFPPLWIDLKKDAAKGSVFDAQNRLKLVTHCRSLSSGADAGSDFVWLEYLAYRIFNEITPVSFRARSLAISYIETGKDVRYLHPGFFIEHKKRLAKRTGYELTEVERSIARDDLLDAPSQDVELLQYLLGNTDFSIVRGPDGDTCCHNVVLLHEGAEQAPPYVPVPYDFDITGFVDPPKAQPAEGLGLRRITQRLYRGYCRDRAIVDASIAKYRRARPAIEALLETPELSKRARNKAAGFLEGFFAVIEDPAEVDDEIRKDCRGAT